MAIETHSFFGLQACDEVTGFFIVHEVYLDRLEELPEWLRVKINPLSVDQSEPIDDAQLAECARIWPEISTWEKLPVRVSHTRSVLPYRVHGGRELDLMCKGLKPLSVFSYVETDSEEAHFLSTYFAPLVERGTFAAGKIEERIEGKDGDGEARHATFLYALAGEAWRIEAYRLMKAVWRVTPWNDALELTEGTLLDYTPEQNAYLRAYRERHGLRWGLQAFYRFLGDAEIEFVRQAGRKAFRFDDDPARLYLPHWSPDPIDPVGVLKTIRRGMLARFYVPMIKLRHFSHGVERHGNLEWRYSRFLAKSKAASTN